MRYEPSLFCLTVIAVSDIKPGESVFPKYTFHLIKDVADVADVHVDRGFQTEAAFPGLTDHTEAARVRHLHLGGPTALTCDAGVPARGILAMDLALQLRPPLMLAFHASIIPHCGWDAVVTQGPVGRGGDDAVHRSIL